MGRSFVVYILANVRVAAPVIYVGVTNNVVRRVAQHRTRPLGFVAKYRLDTLVYFEHIDGASAAIAREKRIKGWTRAKKIALIESQNPTWCDLLGDETRALGE